VVNIIVIALLTEGGFISTAPKSFVTFGTPFAFIIVNLILIAGLLLEEAHSKKTVSRKIRVIRIMRSRILYLGIE
jgi:hypothetical protein